MILRSGTSSTTEEGSPTVLCMFFNVAKNLLDTLLEMKLLDPFKLWSLNCVAITFSNNMLDIARNTAKPRLQQFWKKTWCSWHKEVKEAFGGAELKKIFGKSLLIYQWQQGMGINDGDKEIWCHNIAFSFVFPKNIGRPNVSNSVFFFLPWMRSARMSKPGLNCCSISYLNLSSSVVVHEVLVFFG